VRSPGKAAPAHKHAEWFCRWHLGKHCFAPFTGQDYPAWRAFVYLVECWCAGGGDAAIAAMAATVRCAQPKYDVLQVFVQTIPFAGDWTHVRQIWPRIVGDLFLVGAQTDARTLRAFERWSGESDHGTWHGWQLGDGRGTSIASASSPGAAS
jgi:hypothetical protein